ncbi:peflin-like [Chrysoperla carnea]|uniref:peflin-like n=1 Tax=Chrysoperla carnea TaxID=189513 RepID=UPI001D0957FB|nr:peflin-like [Chrysoperla carnea]
MNPEKGPGWNAGVGGGHSANPPTGGFPGSGGNNFIPAPINYPPISTIYTSTSSPASSYNAPGEYRLARNSDKIRIEVQDMFNAIDINHFGHITYDQFKETLVDNNNKNFSETACRMIFKMFDRDGNGVIDVYEFQEIYDFISKWETIFVKYDRDKSNTLNKTELAQALKQVIGYGFSQKFLDALFISVDNDGRQQIDADQFIVLFVQLERLTNEFKQRDRQQTGEISMDYDDFMFTALSILF